MIYLPFKILKKFTERGEKFLLFFFVRLPMNLNTKRHTPIAYNGWVFVSGFALHNAQFKGQMLMAKLAQIPC